MNDEMKDWRRRVETYVAAAKTESGQAGPYPNWVWGQGKAASERAALGNRQGQERGRTPSGGARGGSALVNGAIPRYLASVPVAV